MQSSKDIVRSLLGLRCDYRIKTNILSREEFDYFVFPLEKFAIYAYNYDLDGAGMGLCDVGSRTSYLWPFDENPTAVGVWANQYVTQMESILANERCFLLFDHRVEMEYDANNRNETDFRTLQDIIRWYEES